MLSLNKTVCRNQTSWIKQNFHKTEAETGNSVINGMSVILTISVCSFVCNRNSFACARDAHVTRMSQSLYLIAAFNSRLKTFSGPKNARMMLFREI